VDGRCGCSFKNWYNLWGQATYSCSYCDAQGIKEAVPGRYFRLRDPVSYAQEIAYQWHEWWALNFRDIRGYLKEALKFIIMMPVFVYLLIATAIILFKTGLRLMFALQIKRKVKNE
jgi:hypothetical protein